MRDRLIELLLEHTDNAFNTSEDKHFIESTTIGQVADTLLANGVIVPPSKVGDTVYWIDNEKIKSCEVFEISIHSDGILIHTGIQFCLKPDAVYHTKKEAEKALRKEDESNG